MRKNIYNIFAVLAAVFALSAAVSCQEETPETPKPVFPEMVTDYDVVPGTEIHLTIQPNLPWKLNVSEQGYKWFKIKDGRFDVASLSGAASTEPIDITIVTSAEESFSIRACEITLTMGGESKVIAKYTLQTIGKAIEVYSAKKSENGFEYSDNSYVYSETALTENDVVELVWDENSRSYSLPIMVRANFEWEIEWPEWTRADITATSRIGDVELELYGISSKLPMEAATGVINFKSGDEVKKTCKISIPASKDKFDFSLSGYTELQFDHASYLHSGSGSYSKEPVMGFIFGAKESRVLVLECTDGKYAAASTAWLNVTTGAWDSIEGAEVLQEREISITAPKYYGADQRQALVLILPATAPSNVDDLLVSDKTKVKDEYAEYAISVVQSGRPTEYFTFEETAEVLEEAAVAFTKSTETLLPSKNFTFAQGCENWQYHLTYEKEYSASRAALFITDEYDSVEIYDVDGNLITENLSEHWLGYVQHGEGLYGQVTMDENFMPEGIESIEGYMVFKNERGAVLCVVHCKYVPEIKSLVDILEDAGRKMFVVNAQATQYGATIHKVMAGPTYEKYKEHQAPIYIVRFPVNNLSLQIRTSQQCQMYSCVGKKNGPEMVTIDDQIFLDKEIYALVEEYLAKEEQYRKDLADYNSGKTDVEPVAPKYPDVSNEKSTMGLLTFGPTSMTTRVYPGYSKFNMKMPEGVTEKKMEEVLLFGTSEVVRFVFVCVLDLENQQ